jgi:hypothetical protein
MEQEVIFNSDLHFEHKQWNRAYGYAKRYLQ